MGIMSLSGCTRIGPGNAGIEVDLAGSQRGVQDFPIKTGRVWFNPWSTEIIEYPTYVQTAIWTKSAAEGHPENEEITFTTKDAMVVAMDVNLSYALQYDKVPEFYVKFRLDDIDKFTHGFLRNIARDCINEVAGNFGVEAIMGDNAPFLKEARGCLQDRVAPYGVRIETFGIIGAPRPPDQVIQSINAKVQASQIALQKQNEVLQAEADAKSRVATAQGDAESQIARAKGEAESNRIKSGSIDDKLIQWYRLTNDRDRIGKWDGRMPNVVTGASGTILQIPSEGSQK